ncbi:MAG: hypothetical protein Q9225_005589 [Loekoesia sp. 1 TL-2023]
MSLLGRIFADEEELGKKDDDRKRGKANMLPTWSARKPASSASGYRKRTVLYGLIACITLYLFFKNIPEPSHPPVLRPSYTKSPRDQSSQKPKVIPETPTQKPPRPEKPSEAEKHYYDGPIRFYQLAASLHAVSWLRGHMETNKNVLFAASNLRSASELIPIACEMANWERNDVHFALMGRDDLEMDEIKKLNGVDEQCTVTWHDARPDFSPWSSDFRMEVSVSAALGHIQTFMHPQLVITDDATREDGFFTKAIRAKTFELGRSIIELPTAASENLMWIARLDSSSLAAWHTTYVDILIHAPPYSSGSLLRLLKSIEAADYFGHRRPHLTIELPADIDPPTWAYLEGLTWPPLDSSGAPHTSQVTLRHRVPRTSGSAEEASIRHVESFYPARPADSHVLVLSPHVELSPLYYHFLMYYLLEFKYSSSSSYSPQVKDLMGLSLELPYIHLNDSMLFSPPTTLRKSKDDDEKRSEESTSFLWQAPNSNAALYFGDKWIEFHSFLTSRVALDPAKQPGRRKLISDLYPAWLEYLQELMRARGYTLLYPNFPSSSGSESIASLHYELYRPPEELAKPTSKANTPVPTLNPQDTFPTNPTDHLRKPTSHPESTPLTSNLLSLLPPTGIVEDLFDLPLLSHEGNEVEPWIFESFARTFAADFRRQVGQCPASHKPTIEPMKADDLFCDRNENLRVGLGLGDLTPAGVPRSGPPKPVIPVIKDEDEIRQSEFEAHLRRQGGGKEEKQEGGEEADEEDETSPASKKEKPEKAKGEKSEGKESKEETGKAPEEKPRGW